MGRRTLRRISLPITLAGAALFLLPVALLASEGGGHEAGGIGPILWNMGIKVIDFGILAFVLYRVLSKPLANYLAARAEAVRSGIRTLEEQGRIAEESAREYAEKLDRIEEEIRRVKEDARREMEQERVAALDEARRASEQLVQHAREAARREFAKAKADLHREAVNLSTELAEGLIVKQINDADQVRFAQDYIKRIEERP